MKPVISPDVIYIGQDCPEADLFEGQYDLPEGMCYNSFVILDEKVAVMDTVDALVSEAWRSDLLAALGGRVPDYLVVHHMEPDHSAQVVWAMEHFPQMKLVCSAKALAMIPLYFPEADFAGRTLTVAEGDTLVLGRHTLRFFAAPMVHWPEVMVSFDEADGLLFSADAFGKFGVYGAEPDDWACEARRYYFNICGKYGASVSALLRKAEPLPLKMILPLHGPLLSGEAMSSALALYKVWSAYGSETEGVFVAHASFHGHTSEAAQTLAQMLRESGCPKVAVSDLTREDPAEAVEDAFRYPVTVIAATTYDGAYHPAAQKLLTTLKAKAWQGKTVALIENGSWAPQAARLMRAELETCKNITFIEPAVTLRGAVKSSDIAAMRTLCDNIMKTLKN